MAGMEERAGKRKKKHDIERAAFAAVALAGVLAVTAVAPGVLLVLKYIPKNRFTFNVRAESALTRLKKKGLVEFVERKGVKYARLTEEGKRTLAYQQEILRLKEEKKGKWDEQWRMVMFDVPERRRSVRARLREVMRIVGFVRVQDSAWVYPYHCEEFVALLKAELKIGKDVLYIIISEMEHDRALRTHFKLPPH